MSVPKGPLAKLTVKMAAEKAGVSAALVYKWCDERRLRHYRLGGEGKKGKILIEESDLEAFLQSVCVEATGNPDEGPLKHIC
jgi:excisionase family DNA binding protein